MIYRKLLVAGMLFLQNSGVFAQPGQWHIRPLETPYGGGKIPAAEEKWESSAWAAAQMMRYMNHFATENLEQFNSTSEYREFRDHCPRTVDCRRINTYRSGVQAMSRIGSMFNPFSHGPAEPTGIKDFSVAAIPQTLTQYMNQGPHTLHYLSYNPENVLRDAIFNIMKGYPVIANIKVGEIELAHEIPADYHQSVIDSGFSEILSMKAPEIQYIVLTGYNHSRSQFTYLNSDGSERYISLVELQEKWLWKMDISEEIAIKVREFSKISWVRYVGLGLVTDILEARGGTLITIDEGKLLPRVRGHLPLKADLPDDLAHLL